MPYAKFDVDLHRRFADIPAKHRAACIALYFRAVTLSAELLLDGEISAAVLAALAPEVGVKPRTETGRTFPLAVNSLIQTGLFTRTAGGGVTITEWRTHHSARGDVFKRRNRDAELKREARAQLVLPDVVHDVRRGHPRGQGRLQPGMSAADPARAQRAQADRENQERKTSAVDLRENGTGDQVVHSTGLSHQDDDPEPTLR